jgi:hypothetical protein
MFSGRVGSCIVNKICLKSEANQPALVVVIYILINKNWYNSSLYVNIKNQKDVNHKKCAV